MWILGVIILVAVFGPMVWVQCLQGYLDAATIAPTLETGTFSAPTSRDVTCWTAE